MAGGAGLSPGRTQTVGSKAKAMLLPRHAPQCSPAPDMHPNSQAPSTCPQQRGYRSSERSSRCLTITQLEGSGEGSKRAYLMSKLIPVGSQLESLGGGWGGGVSSKVFPYGRYFQIFPKRAQHVRVALPSCCAALSIFLIKSEPINNHPFVLIQ